MKLEEYRIVRRRIIDGILSTDMASHSKNLLSFKNKLESLGIEAGQNLDKLISNDIAKNYENQQNVLSMCIHTADLSNPAKLPEVYDKWVELLFIEFFNQGDVEKSKGLPVSMLCDRETTFIPKTQIGFINFIVIPQFEIMKNLIPEIKNYIDYVQINLKRNEELCQKQSKNS